MATAPGAPDNQDFEKIVDDVIVWNNDIEEAFFRVCNILSHSNRSGMVFSPEKFNFAKEGVEYAGIIISKDGIRPTDKYLQTILKIPTPKNIHDIRAWFGLINQISSCFATSTVMAPFRHLLCVRGQQEGDRQVDSGWCEGI